MTARPRRRIAALVLAAAAPLAFAAVSHAADAGRSAVALNNPVRCLLADMQCAKDAASGNNPCDPLPC